jgi:hypothetical protein
VFSTNPPKAGGGDVLIDLRNGLNAQGETGLFETSISSLAGLKEKTNDPFSRRAMLQGSSGAAPKERKTFGPWPYRGSSSCFPHLKMRQTSSERVFTGSWCVDGEPFSWTCTYQKMCSRAQRVRTRIMALARVILFTV